MLIKKKAEIKVLKKLDLVIILKILKKGRIKKFEKLVKAVYTALAIYVVLTFLDV
jgi:hypothetical protein